MTDDAVVALTIPADPAFFHVARSVVTAVAGQLSLPVEVVDDVRLAVAECCNMLAAQPGRGHLHIRTAVEDGALEIRISADDVSAPDAPPTDSLSWTIVSSLADDVRWERDVDASSVLTRWQLLGAASP